MKLVALLALLVAGCGSSSSPSDGAAGAGGGGGASTDGASGSDGANADGVYPVCPQHRVEGSECPSPTAPGGVLRKDGHICASCIGRDATGQLTPTPVGCLTVAGDDLCVADCGECS
jgi:hypothetical protein